MASKKKAQEIHRKKFIAKIANAPHDGQDPPGGKLSPTKHQAWLNRLYKTTTREDAFAEAEVPEGEFRQNIDALLTMIDNFDSNIWKDTLKTMSDHLSCVKNKPAAGKSGPKMADQCQY